MMSYFKTESAVQELLQVLSDYYAKKVQEEADRLWDDGTLDAEAIEKQMGHNTAARIDKQPTSYPNAGSVFKNPHGDAAGRLIDQIGAKGWRQGDAMVSEKHANFIVNVGQATCADVLALIDRIKKTVLQETGITLEEEILYLHDENL